MKYKRALIRDIMLTSLVWCILLCGCGGGTTGTSSTTTLRMTGRVEDPDGARVSSSSIVVIAEGKGPVASTATDPQGEFEISISGDIEKFRIEVDQAPSSFVQRDTRGNAVMSTRVVRSSDTSADVEFFEAQIEREKLCRGVQFEGSTIRIVDAQSVASCEVSAQIKAGPIFLSDFQSGIVGTCQGIPIILSMGSVIDGVARAGLAGVTAECQDIRFVIFVRYDPLQLVSFPIVLE